MGKLRWKLTLIWQNSTRHSKAVLQSNSTTLKDASLIHLFSSILNQICIVPTHLLRSSGNGLNTFNSTSYFHTVRLHFTLWYCLKCIIFKCCGSHSRCPNYEPPEGGDSGGFIFFFQSLQANAQSTPALKQANTACHTPFSHHHTHNRLSSCVSC